MFNIKRFDPSAPAPSAAPTDALSSLAAKIEERKRKRSAADADLESPSSAAPAPPTTAAAPVAEWQPAAGESPAEREKREKREKRQQRMGVTFASEPAGPSGSMYVPPPVEQQWGRQQEAYESTGASALIHPDRMGAPALRKEVEKEPKAPKALTPSRKKYLKKKRERKAGKKAGEPAVRKASKRAKVDPEVEVEGEGDKVEGAEDSDDSDDSDDERYRNKKAEEKRLDILKKKEERKVKRDEKKAELRALRAAGLPAPPPTVRVLPTAAPTPIPTDLPTPSAESTAEPTAEDLELAVEAEQRAARKETKRLKRSTRRLSPAPSSPSTLIPTAPTTERSPSPIPELPLEKEEPAPLLRLPGATRPAPPSKRTLGALKVHESVRQKTVVDPELKVSFVAGGELGVGERGVKRLGEMGFTEAFAVQTAVFPLLLSNGRALYAPFDPPRDICVSAPTGSGKTLSYVVPIVETLSTRIVTRLRALILLPTRDLVAQVRETFEAFGKGTGLKLGTATGQHSFAQEQLALVGDGVQEGSQGGSSNVDILISTPGRLMDHIRSTPGFSLQHLRFLVIDEADRLLNQSFHDWLPSILAALKPPVTLTERNNGETTADVLAPEWWDASVGRVESDLDERCFASCQKLLFSATLSRDPAKIDALHLNRPVYVSVEDGLDGNADDDEIDDELKFTLPATLKEHMIVSPASHKPLYLFHLLHTLALDSALCFTKSVEAATRLAKLVELFEEERTKLAPKEEEEAQKKVVVKAYSSELPPSERTKILASFKKGEIQMLICSDLISRGIDLPHVSHVISYDVPTDMRKYVHRVGRTARAGKSGDAWSLVEDQEAAPFKAIMTSAQHLQKIARVRVKDHAVEPFVPQYQVALERLRVHFATGREKGEKTA